MVNKIHFNLYYPETNMVNIVQFILYYPYIHLMNASAISFLSTLNFKKRSGSDVPSAFSVYIFHMIPSSVLWESFTIFP